MTVASYLENIEEDRKEAFTQLRNTIINNLPTGFEERIQYKMISYVVPHSMYPAGYHCTPTDPLPFISIANQKGFIALYNMGIYGSEELLNWFTSEWPKHSTLKLDMGKSCIRFKKVNAIPFELIAELVSKISPEKWIEMYEKAYVKK